MKRLKGNTNMALIATVNKILFTLELLNTVTRRSMIVQKTAIYSTRLNRYFTTSENKLFIRTNFKQIFF